MSNSDNSSGSKILTTAVQIAALLGGGFAILEYIGNKKDQSIRATLQYVERFDAKDTGIGVSQRILADFYKDNSENLHVLSAVETSKEHGEDLRNRVIMQMIDEINSRGDVIYEINGFFSTMRICVVSGICNKGVAVDYFGCYAKNYYSNFSNYIEELAAFYPNYGEGVEFFSEQAEDC